MAAITVGDRVKLSTAFIRSMGCLIPHATETGTVTEVVAESGDWVLVRVQWPTGAGNINRANLVHIQDVAREARQVEHDGKIPGLVLGGNAFARPFK